MHTMHTFSILTEYGREAVEDFSKVKENLQILARKKKGFVRLEINPPMKGKRYLETIYDEKKKAFYTCMLEDRAEGQGFWEYWSKTIPKWRYKLILKYKFGGAALSFFMQKKPLGAQRSVVAEGMKEKLYIQPYEIHSNVYGDKEFYGGDQTHPQKASADSEEGKRLRQIVKKYFPDYEEEQINAFLKKLYSEGCGYVVIINTLMEHFDGKEELFEKTFGFPMYNEDGDLNYDMLLLDFYAATDNHIQGKQGDEINYEEDRNEKEQGDDYVYSLDTTGIGTTFSQRIYRTQLYLKDKGVVMRITNNKPVTLGTFRQLAQKGRVMISLRGGNVQNEDGSTYSYCPGHAMIVTGITNDCRYIVSTWGKKLYVDPFEMVEKDGKRTEIYFQYFELI